MVKPSVSFLFEVQGVENCDAVESLPQFPAFRLNLGEAASPLTQCGPGLAARKGREAMKTELQQNAASAISWVARVGQLKLKPVTEPLSAIRRDSRLAKGCEIIGTVFFEGPAIIDGQLEGKISGRDQITVGENGSITTDELSAPSVVIAGTVKAKTIASRRVEILPTGGVWGDLASPMLTIHEGAHFVGRAFTPKYS
jgi:cytoskeletal protein CcmA (bactofilin family)